MTIYFSEIFKKMRKERNLTQEQIADVLRVSPQAVSRWETGATYPDIALLPSIAEFFDTTVDVLLGTGKARAAERIDGFQRRYEELFQSGNFSEAAELMRAAVKEFPNSFPLQFRLLEVLLALSEKTQGTWAGTSDLSGTLSDGTAKEISEIGERILSYCTDDQIRLYTKIRLGQYYCKIGRLSRGEEIFRMLPHENCSMESQILAVYTGEEKKSALGGAVDRSVYLLLLHMRQLLPENDSKAELDFSKQTLQILDTVYENSDFGGRYWEFATVCTAYMARSYAKTGDLSRALLCLSKTAEFIGEVTKLPLSDRAFTTGEISDTGRVRALKEQMREDLLKDPLFAPLSGNPSFLHLFDAVG